MYKRQGAEKPLLCSFLPCTQKQKSSSFPLWSRLQWITYKNMQTSILWVWNCKKYNKASLNLTASIYAILPQKNWNETNESVSSWQVSQRNREFFLFWMKCTAFMTGVSALDHLSWIWAFLNLLVFFSLCLQQFPNAKCFYSKKSPKYKSMKV